MSRRRSLAFLKKNAAALLFLAAAIISTVVVLLPLADPPARTMRIDNEPVQNLDDGWVLIADGEASPAVLPYTSPVGTAGSFTLRRGLPASIAQDSALCVDTYSVNLQAFIDGKPVYQYNISGGTLISKSFGYYFHIIPVPREVAGKEVTLVLEPQDASGIGIVYDTFFGTKSAIVFQLIRQNIGVLISGLLMLALGAALVVAGFFTKSRKMFAYLGVFAIFSAIWIITDTQLLQLFFNNQAVAYLASFSSFMLLPVPFLLFLKEVGDKKRNRLLDILVVAFVASYLVNIVLSACGVMPLSNSIRFTHVLIVVTVVVSLLVFSKDAIANHDKEAWFIAAGFFVLGAFALLDIFRFYSPTPGNNSTFFRIGLILFVSMFAIGAFIKNQYQARINDELIQNSRMMDFYVSSLERQNAMAAQTAQHMLVFRHDLRHITNMIAMSLDRGDVKGASELLSSIEKNVGTSWAGRPPEPFTNHQMLDSTIAFYLNYARQNGIETTLKIGQVNVPRTDKTELAELAVVLANALENAVDACRQLPEGRERVLRLTGSQHGKQYFWEIVNSCDPAKVHFSPETDLPVNKAEGHGYGTQSMAVFAKKYRAILRFFVEGELFHMQLLV